MLRTDVCPTPGPCHIQPSSIVEVTVHFQKSTDNLINLKMPERNWVPFKPRMKRIT